MRLADVSSARRRACKAATNSNHSHPIAPSLLMRSFTFQRPDQAWGDITYIPTGEGWLYLAIVKDLCTRKIVGYAFSELLNRLSERIDTQLALAALEMAYRRRKPPKGSIPPGPRRSAMCLPIWSLSTIPVALTPLWVGFLPLVSRRNFATPLPNHRYHIPHQSFQVFSYFSVRFSGNGSVISPAP